MSKNSYHRPLIYLADLTHTGQMASANVHPLGIGLIAAYLLKQLGAVVDVELFKYPEDLEAALDTRVPDIMGFSNYCWNLNLSYGFARQIKKIAPGTAIVFGGPNYGLTEDEIDSFWRRHPNIDFHIVGEGEEAFLQLYRRLAEAGFDSISVQSDRHPPANTHFQSAAGNAVIGDTLPRIKNLDDVPSPYLMGLMDKFFDGVLIPALHTTRGCPFSCTFCSEGRSYYSKVAKRENLTEELEYMAARVDGVPDLIMSDANFGMYKEDREKARTIAALFDKYQWPKHIQVAGGKNQKHRLREIMMILKGRMDVSASLQTVDGQILENIRRQNISFGELNDLGAWSQKIQARSFVELILGLPGDTVAAHKESLAAAARSGVNLVRMHQLMLLPQTEMVTSESRERYGMKTKYRVAPRSFGRYRAFGNSFVAVEYDEICVFQDSMNFDEYMECRMLDLTVELIHNSSVFTELFTLAEGLNLDWPALVFEFHAMRDEFPKNLAELYDRFYEDSTTGLWDDISSLVHDVHENLDRYLQSNEGVNQLAITNAKARSFMEAQVDIHNVFYDLFFTHLQKRQPVTVKFAEFIDEMRHYSLLRKSDVLNTDCSIVEMFQFNMPQIFSDRSFIEFENHRLPEPASFVLDHDSLQRDTVSGYVRQYGTSLAGFGRVLMKVPIHRILRHGRLHHD